MYKSYTMVADPIIAHLKLALKRSPDIKVFPAEILFVALILCWP